MTYQHVLINDIKINYAARDREVRKYYLIHNQLRATKFRAMWIYAFFVAKITTERAELFERPVVALFRHIATSCSKTACVNAPIIKCAHCVRHFFFY